MQASVYDGALSGESLGNRVLLSSGWIRRFRHSRETAGCAPAAGQAAGAASAMPAQ